MKSVIWFFLSVKILKKLYFCRFSFSIDFVPKTLREHWMVPHTLYIWVGWYVEWAQIHYSIMDSLSTYLKIYRLGGGNIVYQYTYVILFRQKEKWFAVHERSIILQTSRKMAQKSSTFSTASWSKTRIHRDNGNNSVKPVEKRQRSNISKGVKVVQRFIL